MKYIDAFAPMLVVIAIAIDLIAAYTLGNTPAVWANVTALIGWIVLASNAFQKFASK